MNRARNQLINLIRVSYVMQQFALICSLNTRPRVTGICMVRGALVFVLSIFAYCGMYKALFELGRICPVD